MKSYLALAWKELKAQKITAILILVAVIMSTIMTTVIGQSIGILQSMRIQQAAGLNGNRYATFHQLGKEFLYIFCCDAVDQRFIVFCIIDTCVEILIQIAQPVAVFLLGVFVFFQHILFDLLHVFGRRTFFGHFFQLFDDDAR